MNPWSNIEVSTQDSELNDINKFEKTLGDIPVHVQQIRELITRFEVCHFKYQQHLKYIHDSIKNIDPTTDPGKIGTNHISKGENVWKNDSTGRSLLGQQYLWILKNWLTNNIHGIIPDHFNNELDLRIKKWLGDKNPNKERFIQLLIARLTYDWESYEKLQHGGQFKELEYQICRMDICHYAFPKHLDSLLQAIGEMKSHNDMDGCGSFNSVIKDFVEDQFSKLCCIIQDMIITSNRIGQNKNDQIKLWLYACLAKTLKEQIRISKSISNLTQ